jgi:Bifunctional DNA primase/polymerase, N-terminal/Primase C terminal 1 (PriCT-1)
MESLILQTANAALSLARRGFHVFPCVARDKRPATPHGCRDATVDPAVITRWWREDPDMNLAIATGVVSNLLVVDIDGTSGELELRKLEAQHGALPATPEVTTSRGRHLYLRPGAALLRNTAGKIAPGIDTRADGGYVLAPPSVHPSGARYTWYRGNAKTIAQAPAWLLEKLSQPSGTATPVEEWRGLVADGAGEGTRNSTVTKLCGHLLRRFVDPFVVLDLMQAWNASRCRPPLPEEDITRIVDSVCALEHKRRGGS